jgi:putative transcriptional regulator
MSDKRSGYRSRILAEVHEGVRDLARAGLVSKRTLRDFDALCLTKIKPMYPTEIQKLRKREGVSQGVFARYLNVTPIVVSKWERGEKHPSAPSLKLLSLVKKNGLDAIA